ncbi:phosphoesterase family-domain-containing protein [Chytriomyces sp. MP71]|nr:phosphoesterase family-domain-containing protein [Chytriomyces sp. MP71]
MEALNTVKNRVVHAAEHVASYIDHLIHPDAAKAAELEIESQLEAEHNGSPIKHFVVLQLENRSFDSLLGHWAKDRPGVDGIPEGAHNVDSATGNVYPATANAQWVQRFDPDHEVDAATHQIYGVPADVRENATADIYGPGCTAAISLKPVGQATNSGFVDQAVLTDRLNLNSDDIKVTDLEEARTTVMSGFQPSTIPVTIALAEEFGVFDAWHAGIPGPTFPNRIFLASATSNGMTYNDNGKLIAGLPQPSVFGLFANAGLTYKNYFNQVPTGLMFNDFRKVVETDLLELNPEAHAAPLSHFFKDCEEGTLPTFSWIDPIFQSVPGIPANDNHPPHDVARGEALLKSLYEALRKSPQWEQTAFLITYDEHGGFYDHVLAPTNVPAPDEASLSCATFRFDRLGLRVPTILVSPRIPRGSVFHHPPDSAPRDFRGYSASRYDHSSLIHSMNDLFKLGAQLNDRARWSGSFAREFLKVREARKDCVLVLPDAPAITPGDEILDKDDEWGPVIALFQKLYDLI